MQFLLKFLCTKIVKQFVFLVQSIVLQHMFLTLWNNNAFISFMYIFLFWNWVSYSICTQEPRTWGFIKEKEKFVFKGQIANFKLVLWEANCGWFGQSHTLMKINWNEMVLNCSLPVLTTTVLANFSPNGPWPFFID